MLRAKLREDESKEAASRVCCVACALQVLENVVVGGSLNVGVIMGNSSCKRGIAVDFLDEVGKAVEVR